MTEEPGTNHRYKKGQFQEEGITLGKGINPFILRAMGVQTLLPFYCPVGRCCRIHWLHICRGVRPLTSVVHMTLNNLMMRFQYSWSFGGMQSKYLLPSLPGPLWPRGVTPDKGQSMGEIELNCVLMLNWIARNRSVMTLKMRTHAKVNCLK